MGGVSVVVECGRRVGVQERACGSGEGWIGWGDVGGGGGRCWLRLGFGGGLGGWTSLGM